MKRPFFRVDQVIAAALAAGEPGAAVYARLIAECNHQLRHAPLAAGRALAAWRTAVHIGLLRAWVTPLIARYGLTTRFAMVALGGTGRREMAPASDLDVAYLVTDPAAAAPLLAELERQTVHGAHFEQAWGFAFRGQILLAHPPEELEALSFEQLTSLQDMRWLAGSVPVVVGVRAALRAALDPLALYLHQEAELRAHLAAATAGGLHLKRLLRRMQSALWLRGTAGFTPVSTLLRALDEDTRAAYWLTHRVRGLCHLVHADLAPGARRHRDRDLVTAATLMAAADQLAAADGVTGGGARAAILDRVLTAFECLDGFARRTLATARQQAPCARDLPVTLRHEGLDHGPQVPATSNEQAATAVALLVAVQRYGLPLTPSATHQLAAARPCLTAPHNLYPLLSNPGLHRALAVAVGHGLIAPLFVGSAAVAPWPPREPEAEPAARTLLGAVAALDEYAGLDVGAGAPATHSSAPPAALAAGAARAAGAMGLAAVRLALISTYLQETGVLPESSSVLGDYFASLAMARGCPAELAALAQAVLEHRTLLPALASAGTRDAQRVHALCAALGSARVLHALVLFHCARQQAMATTVEAPALRQESAAPFADHLWFNLAELYQKALDTFAHTPDSSRTLLLRAGFDAAEAEVLADLGPDFYSGAYAKFIRRLGAHALRVAAGECSAKAVVLHEHGQRVIAMIARNTPGLAAALLGALDAASLRVRQAHLFTASRCGFVLDFFHVAGVIDTPLLARLEAAGTAPAPSGPLPPRPAGVALALLEHPADDSLQRLELRLAPASPAAGTLGKALYWLTARLSMRCGADIHFVAAPAHDAWVVGFRCESEMDGLDALEVEPSG